MKRTFVYCLFLFIYVLSFAQSENTFYIYRNDGEFNAFMYSAIDSIAFSTIDTDGDEHEFAVTQEVWTADSVYRIPLAVIDSVGLKTPSTVINKDVFPLTAAHNPFIVSGDTEGFIMRLDTPDYMRPQKNNIVAADYDCQSFPNGIIAKVTSVNETAEGIRFSCEPVTLDEVYDQIVYFGDAETPSQIPSGGVQRVKASGMVELWNENFNRTWEYGGTTTTVQANDQTSCTVTVCKTKGKPLYVRLDLTNSVSSSIEFNAESETNISPEPCQIGKTLKCGRITFPHPALRFLWLEPQISLFGYFEEKGSIDLDFSAHFNRTDQASLIYTGGEWDFRYSASTDIGADVARISMKGSAEVGLTPQILLALNGSRTGVGVTYSCGLKQTAEFSFDAIEHLGSGAYDALKDSRTQFFRTQSASIFVQSGLFSKDAKRGEFNIFKSESLIDTRYLLPAFDESYQQQLAGGHLVSIDVTRKPIVPVGVAMALYDGSDLVETVDDGDVCDTGSTGLNYTFTKADASRKFTAYPLIRLGGVEMRATPGIDLDYCPGDLMGGIIEADDAIYVRDAKADYIECKFNATLEDSQNIERWGIAFYENGEIHDLWAFDDVGHEGVLSLYLVHDSQSYAEEDYRVDYSTYKWERDLVACVFVDKKDSETGKIKRIFGPSKDITVRYQKKPSISIALEGSETTLIGSEDHTYDTQDGGTVTVTFDQYETVAACQLTLEGTFWMEHLEREVWADEGIEYYKTSEDEYLQQDDTFNGAFIWKYWSVGNLNATVVDVGYLRWVATLRDGDTVVSDAIVWDFTNGPINSVYLSSASLGTTPASKALRMQKNNNPYGLNIECGILKAERVHKVPLLKPLPVLNLSGKDGN